MILKRIRRAAWANDGKSIVFRSLQDSRTLAEASLYTVPATGGPTQPLPMPEAGSGAVSADSAKMVYSPQSRDFRSEKRYSGGEANQLHIFDLKTFDAKKITDSPRPSRDPMWVGNTIYFNSDRDGHFNLYAYDVGGGASKEQGFRLDQRLRSRRPMQRCVREYCAGSAAVQAACRCD